MKTYVLIYDNFRQFEVVLACYFMKTTGSEIVTVALKDREILPYEGFRTRPHQVLAEVNLDDVGLLIIPGGEPEPMYDNLILNDVLAELDDREIPIAAICGAGVHLAKAGILQGRSFVCSLFEEYLEDFDGAIFVDDNVVVDGNIITAKPNAYVDFALEIGKMLDIYDDVADYRQTVDFFRNFKDA